MNKKLLSAIAVAVIPTAVFFAGPRPNKSITPQTIRIPADLDDYLKQKEASIGDVFEGFEKQVHWHAAAGEKTEVSVIYMHGFSASRHEVSPLVENLGDSLQANVFFTRLKGHGRPSRAMAEASIDDWINDGLEALEIGRRIGDKVVVVANSTGATISTWLMAHPDLAGDVEAHVIMSANYGPKDGTARVLLWPWGGKIAEFLQGKERSWEPHNELHGRYWTTSYPTSTLVDMMGLVDLVDETDLSTMRVPTLSVYSPRDAVVDPARIESTFLEFGSTQKKLVPFTESEDPSSHILAGDIMSESTTEDVKQIILNFLKEVGIDS
mgnify:CR=1 FL=1